MKLHLQHDYHHHHQYLLQSFAILDCPSLDHLHDLRNSDVMNTPRLDCAIHLCSDSIAHSPEYLQFLDTFPKSVKVFEKSLLWG